MAVKLAEVQTLYYQRLIADAALTALVVPENIRNHIPQDNPLPYVRFRMSTVGNWDTKSSDGYEAMMVCDEWVEQHGDLLILQIHDAIYAALQRNPLPLTEGQNVLVNFVSFNTFVEPDGQSHHGISTFRFILTD